MKFENLAYITLYKISNKYYYKEVYNNKGWTILRNSENSTKIDTIN